MSNFTTAMQTDLSQCFEESTRLNALSTSSTLINTRRTILASLTGLFAVGVSSLGRESSPSKPVLVGDLSWTLWVNSQFLPTKMESLIKQLQTNPGRFAFNYAFVAGQSIQAKQMNLFMSQYGLQLEEITFKNWTQAQYALSKGLVDLMFAPAELSGLSGLSVLSGLSQS